MSPVNVRKKEFHCSFAKYSFFELHENNLMRVYFAIYGRFCTIGVFSIFNLNLPNLKSNGNTATFAVHEVFRSGLNPGQPILKVMCSCIIYNLFGFSSSFQIYVEKLWISEYLVIDNALN